MILKARHVLTDFLKFYQEMEFDANHINESLQPQLLGLIGKPSILRKIINSEDIQNLKNFNKSIVDFISKLRAGFAEEMFGSLSIKKDEPHKDTKLSRPDNTQIL
jgi:hypothetical protein